MKIAVLGAGGVGGYFGARLAAAGHDVTFVARGKHLDAMRHGGLHVKSALGDMHLQQPTVVERPDEVGAVDLAMLAVKLWDTETAAQSLRPLAEVGAAVVSFQNGVQKDDILAQHLPRESIIGGVSYIAAVISAPGTVTHSGTMQKLAFGEYDGASSERVAMFDTACCEAGIVSEISADIKRLIWEKFVFLVGLSATTASIRQPIGAIRENPRTRALLLAVMREVVAVGRASGVGLAEDFADTQLAFCDGLPAGMTASMYHDLKKGNRLELPWLSGAVVELGQQLRVATPRNSVVADILELYATGAAG